MALKPRLLAILLTLLLLVSCLSGPGLQYQIPPTRSPIPSPTPTPEPSLRSLAQERGFMIGVAVSPALLKDPVYAGLLSREFNIVTPENAMKFEVLHPQQDRYDFSGGDAIVAFAAAQDMSVRGHTLVWDSQLPAWIKEGSFSREEWIAILHDHIHSVVSHYRGRVASWDVVNEAMDEDGLLRDTLWLRAIGPQYIALAFTWAREADPQAKLFYNDNGGEGLNRKSQAIYALLQGLLQAGVRVDGVGLQMHVSLNSQPAAPDLAANLQRLAELGLETQITEMDVRLQYSQESEAEKLAKQAQMYRETLATCLAASGCTAFVTWGLTDRYSWIPWFTGHPDQPLLFDREGRTKPAYDAVRDVLMGK